MSDDAAGGGAITLRFSDFDTRGYRMVDVPTGYGEWVATYEQTVQDAMDIALLDALSAVPWQSIERAADLGCGTGRTGAWLRSKGVRSIDGVDLTPEMLAVARSRNIYQRLVEADVTATGLQAEAYDLVVSSLVDEHLPDLQPFYREAHRLARPGGFLVVVAYHPHFIMTAGMPTHYTGGSGEPVAIETHVHLLSEHVTAGLRAGWTLIEMRERLIDDEWVALKPKWERFRHQPISVAFAWQRPG
jgi:SAM-dependent methyltransferase